MLLLLQLLLSPLLSSELMLLLVTAVAVVDVTAAPATEEKQGRLLQKVNVEHKFRVSPHQQDVERRRELKAACAHDVWHRAWGATGIRLAKPTTFSLRHLLLF